MEYRIGQFSLVTRIPIKTLRYYHEIGLLEPDRIDPYTGYRSYADEQVETARLIRELRSLEFSIDAVRMALERLESGEDLTELVADQQSAIRERMDELVRLQRRIAGLENAGPRGGGVVERATDAELLATIRFTGAYPEVGAYFPRLMREAGALAVGPPSTLYWQQEYREGDADISVCVPVSRPVETDVVSSLILPGGSVIATVYQGPFEGISAGYRRLFEEVERKAAALATPIRERYLRGPGDAEDADPDSFLTEIILPINRETRDDQE